MMDAFLTGMGIGVGIASLPCLCWLMVAAYNIIEDRGHYAGDPKLD